MYFQNGPVFLCQLLIQKQVCKHRINMSHFKLISIMSRIFQMKEVDAETPHSMAKEMTMDEQICDMIQQTRKAISELNQTEKFHRAKVHYQQALLYKNPRIDIFDENESPFYKKCYNVQTSFFWQFILKTISFIYPYLILLQGNTNGIYKNGSIVLLIIFFIDLIMEVAHTSRDRVRKNSKFSRIIHMKAIILFLLMIEIFLITFEVQNAQGRLINPLRILRSVLPILYVCQVQRSFEALTLAYKQFCVFIIFDCLIIIGFGLIGSIIINMPEGVEYDEYTNNYKNLQKMIFIIYITGSYDAYPDNQIVSFLQSQWYEIFFVIFIFLNMFVFSSIPGSLLFDSYINSRSKYILIDEIKMQHSLILTFVSLGEYNYEINIQKIIDFFHFLYENRIRYIDAITELCLKLNDDGNCTIHVLEFIQLGRILQEKPYLKPPPISDNITWINFRSSFNKVIPLEKWLKKKALPLILTLFALAGVLNSFLFLYLNDNEICSIINTVLSYVFLLDIFIRIIGSGPENYVNGEWNLIDMSSILFSFIFTIGMENRVYSSLLKIMRIYRINFLLNGFSFELLQKFKTLLGTIIIIIPIIARFLPLFMIIYYILGILGMEIFYDTTRLPASETYGGYDQFSNFRSFITTQTYLVQVLTQAGWSSVAFDYAKKNDQHFSLVMLYFLFCHVIIVIVLASVLKGIIWFVFITVSQLFDQEEKSQKNAQVKSTFMQSKVNQYNELQAELKKGSLFVYNTVIKRNLFQTKADQQILNQINKKNKDQKIRVKTARSINKKLYRQFQSAKMLIVEENSKDKQSITENNFLFTMLKKFETTQKIKISDMDQIQNEDLEEHTKELVDNFQINTKSFQFEIVKNQLFEKHLLEKLIAPYLATSKNESLDENINIISEKFTNKKSLEFHIFTMHLLLDIRTEKRKQKELILDTLSKEGIIDECDGKNLLNQQINEQTFSIDQDNIVRQMYLVGTTKNLIEKFEAEYFGDIFGSSFKETNKVTIEPLIKLQSTLTYALKKLMRNPQINSIQFFKILSEIQNNISNQLLKKGSLFKFVYQLQSQKQTWFTIKYTHLNQTKISFLKHGVWLYNNNLIENQIYHGKDIFRPDSFIQNQELLAKTKLMRQLFQTFQTLTLALPANEAFFQSNPSYHKYDSYLSYIDVSKLQRLSPKKFEISKIMAVMLTKQEYRTSEPISYPISDIRIPPPVDLIDFKLNQPESKTYKKLGLLCAQGDEEITANQGLPFAYVLNFLCQISDVMKLYTPNFIHQTETVLNSQIDKIVQTPDEKPINSFTQLCESLF